MFDFLNDPAFSVRNLTRYIRRVPNVYGRLAQIGLFRPETTHLKYVEIEIERDTLSIIPVTAPGTAAPRASGSKRETRNLNLLRIALDDYILADALSGRREAGTQDELMHPLREVGKRMGKISVQHFQTLEFLKWGVLKGDVYDADGTRLLYNVYDLMGEEQETIYFNLAGAGDTVDQAKRDTVRFVEQNLQGDTLTGYHWFCGSEFFDNMAKKAEIRDAYKFFGAHPANPLVNGISNVFQHAGMVFEEHNGIVSYKKPDGTTVAHRFIAEDEAIGVPLGTNFTFVTYYGPAAFIDAVNQEPEDDGSQTYLYARVKPNDDETALRIMTEQRPLPMCLHPRLILKGSMAAAP